MFILHPSPSSLLGDIFRCAPCCSGRAASSSTRSSSSPSPAGVLEGKLHLRAQITAEATDWLNGAGVVVLALLLWDLASSVDTSRWRNRGRGGCWAVLFFTLAGLFALHYWMDRLDPPDTPGRRTILLSPSRTPCTCGGAGAKRSGFSLPGTGGERCARKMRNSLG